MKILYLSYENYIDTSKDHDIMYLNRDSMGNGEMPGKTLWQTRIDQFKPDLVLEREYNDGRAIYTDVIEYVEKNHPDCRTAVWLIDTHVSYARHVEYAKLFDFVFLAISSFVDEFVEKVNMNTFWLPVCWPYSRDEIKNNYRPINNTIVFVGNIEQIKLWFPERAEYIDFLKNHYKEKFYAVTDYENMRTLIREAKVSFNYCIRDDLNFRVFETLGLGTELVTNDVTDLHKIKGLADRVRVYHDKADLITAIDSVVSNISTINTIAVQEWVKENHTLYHRYKSLLRMIMTGKQESF
jgi:hypothetical protein